MDITDKISINQLISNRRTIHQFIPDKLPEKSILLEAIDCARWAPNHHLTQPWHFYILGQQTILAIINLNSEIVKNKHGEKAAAIKFERWSQVPGWFVLSCNKNEDKTRALEDYAACCCAVQNLMLSLWSNGVGVKWTTGDVIRDDRFYDCINVDPKQENVVGLFWYGFAEKIPSITRNSIDQIIVELP